MCGGEGVGVVYAEGERGSGAVIVMPSVPPPPPPWTVHPEPCLPEPRALPLTLLPTALMAREELRTQGAASATVPAPQTLHPEPEPCTREELRTQGAAAAQEAEARHTEFDQHMGEGRAQ